MVDDFWIVYLKECIDGVEKLMLIRKRGVIFFDVMEFLEEIIFLVLYLSGSNICIGMFVYMLDLYIRMNCV